MLFGKEHRVQLPPCFHLNYHDEGSLCIISNGYGIFDNQINFEKYSNPQLKKYCILIVGYCTFHRTTLYFQENSKSFHVESTSFLGRRRLGANLFHILFRPQILIQLFLKREQIKLYYEIPNLISNKKRVVGKPPTRHSPFPFRRRSRSLFLKAFA